MTIELKLRNDHFALTIVEGEIGITIKLYNRIVNFTIEKQLTGLSALFGPD